MKNLLLMLLMIISMIARSDDPTLLKKDQTAPYDGLLFSHEKSQQLKIQIIENESLRKSIDLYKSNEDLYNKKIDILLKQNDNLSSSLYEERKTTFWYNAAFFTLGILATGFAFYGLKQISK